MIIRPRWTRARAISWRVSWLYYWASTGRIDRLWDGIRWKRVVDRLRVGWLWWRRNLTRIDARAWDWLLRFNWSWNRFGRLGRRSYRYRDHTRAWLRRRRSGCWGYIRTRLRRLIRW